MSAIQAIGRIDGKRHLSGADGARNHALAEDIDLVAEETDHRVDRLESGDHHAWVAVDRVCADAGETPLAEGDAELVGFVTLDQAVEHARETGCGELALDVDVDNERAIAFYEKVGFEPRRYRMRAGVEVS